MSESLLSGMIFFAGECLQGHNYLILLLKDKKGGGCRCLGISLIFCKKNGVIFGCSA